MIVKDLNLSLIVLIILMHGYSAIMHPSGQLVTSTANCIEYGQEEWFCTERYDPVCGIDGKTYPNCCFARVYGVKFLASQGACQTPDGEDLPPVAFLENRGTPPSPEDEMFENISQLEVQKNQTDQSGQILSSLITNGIVLEEAQQAVKPFQYFRKTGPGKALLSQEEQTQDVNEELTLEMFSPYVKDFADGLKKNRGIGVRMGDNFQFLQNIPQNFHQQEILIGEDDTRVAINDSTATPFAMIGQLQVGCTAALIGSRYVITAAHCILDRFDRELRDLDFSPAKNGHFEPYGKFEWFNFFLPEAWVENKTASADFAVIMYKNRIADLVGGYLDLQVDCAKELYILNVAGYPSDKTPEGSLYATSCQGVELRCSDMTLIHTCDTFGGMSGAPMISYRKDQDPAFAIRAIHTGGNRQLQLNFGTNITPKVKEVIQSWIEQAEKNFAPLLDYVVSTDAIMKLKIAAGN
eukprot:TRINITY_DN20188_c0_g5_i1.p1 TRINITY_DN20188_c0_g5~~TRINITY_DN20188_c0_g5_i1.p1  ORF type:complete len:466 (-),score=68.04 TRINITY_DN20188_c0_g5_i1:107-1504(-)